VSDGIRGSGGWQAAFVGTAFRGLSLAAVLFAALPWGVPANGAPAPGCPSVGGSPDTRGVPGDGARAYRLQPGDTLEVAVHGAADLAWSGPIERDGTIPYPHLSPVVAGNHTTRELALRIEHGLAAGIVREPHVSVTVREIARPAFVTGAVAKPGTYPVREFEGILEVISRAGGALSDAGDEIQVVRPPLGGHDRRVFRLSRKHLSATGPGATAFAVCPGDRIELPYIGDIVVEGAVRAPGSYRLDAPTLLKAVAMAGGLTFEADTSRLLVYRRSDDRQDPIAADYRSIQSDPSLDPTLQAGDIVVVPTNSLRTIAGGAWRLLVAGFRLTPLGGP